MTVNVKAEELKASILEYVDNKDKPNIHALLEELERQIEYSMYPKAYDEGYEYGYDEGYRQGYSEGWLDNDDE